MAHGISSLCIQAHLSLKCRARHLHHPRGRPGWCHILTRIRGSVSRRDRRMMNRSCLRRRSYVSEIKSLELRVSVDVRSRRHSVAIGLPDGQVLEEFEITHRPEGFEEFFSSIEKHQKENGCGVAVAMEGYNAGHGHSIAWCASAVILTNQQSNYAIKDPAKNQSAKELFSCDHLKPRKQKINLTHAQLNASKSRSQRLRLKRRQCVNSLSELSALAKRAEMLVQKNNVTQNGALARGGTKIESRALRLEKIKR